LRKSVEFVTAQQKDPYWKDFYKQLLKRMEEEDVLNAKIIAKNKGSTLEIKNEAPCYWVDKKKKHWQKFWCNDEGVFHQTRLINEEEVTRVCLPRKYIADALKLVHKEGH
jgi:hypothetical protein